MYFLVLVILPFTIALVGFDIPFKGVFFDAFQIWVLIVVILGVIGLIDFLSLGYFRRYKLVAKILWPLHRFISALTLSRFYRPIYYGMVTNFNKWVFFLFLTVFTLVSIFGAGSIVNSTFPGDEWTRLQHFATSQGNSSFAGYYDDQNEDQPSVRAHIPSDVINGNVLRLFVVANISYEDKMERNTPLDSLKELYPDTSSSAISNMIVSSFFNVKLDGKIVDQPRWYFNYKPHLDQRGYLAYLSIKELEEGIHELVVEGPDSLYSTPFATIPFYRDIVSEVKPERRAEPEETSPDFQPKPFGIRD